MPIASPSQGLQNVSSALLEKDAFGEATRMFKLPADSCEHTLDFGPIGRVKPSVPIALVGRRPFAYHVGVSKPYPFAAVLFDLDGVLIDTTDLHYRVWDEFARSRGFVASREQLLATNGRRADETVRLWLGAGLSDHQIAAITADREMYFNRLLATEPLPAVPGASEFVDALRTAGVPIAVATSATPENARLSLSRVKLDGVFRAIITAADVANGKPDPEPYLKAAQWLGVSPADCLVIEDSVSGIRAAKAAGAKCLALATTFPWDNLKAESPDWLTNGFAGLPSHVQP
jgi:beta-phosphoglucomutase family hydrolase